MAFNLLKPNLITGRHLNSQLELDHTQSLLLSFHSLTMVMYKLVGGKIQDEVSCFVSFPVDEMLSSKNRKHVKDKLKKKREE